MNVDLGLSADKNGNTGVRGELILSLAELKRVQQYLIDNSYYYGFELSPEPINDYNNKKNSKNKSQSNVCRSFVGGLEIKNENEKRKSRSSRPSYSRELKALLEDGMSILESRSETKQKNLQNVVGSRRIIDDLLKKMPDWAKRFHRILKMLSQQEIFKPYVHNVNIGNFGLYLKGQSLENDLDSKNNDKYEFDYNKKIEELFINANIYFEYLKNCSPIKPISFNKIIKKLENNEYINASSVFSDIYSVWICAFRSVEPGGILWTKTIDACLNFNLKLLNEPLKDDFYLTFPGKMKGGRNTDNVNTDGPPFKKTNNSGKNNSIYEERYNKEFYLNNGGTEMSGIDVDFFSGNKNKRTNQQNNFSKPNNKSGKKGASSSSFGSYNSINDIISESERREFQSLLGKLSQNDHVELFNSFLSTAHWKEVNTGEVELDDQKTPPGIFREMIKWCKLKLNIPILDESSSKHINNRKGKGVRQSKIVSNNNILLNKKKPKLSSKRFFSSGRAFNSPSDSEDEDDDISSCGNLQISQQWESSSSSGESENEPELTSFFPHFNSK
ncbi:hypothetical protein FG386_001517 [Cryptosporidium ryanae]|uniref:uncharacterized protein n=1 Tax=Cryptosporidium ryanae TaxID=515981 RepID=UPI00351A8086|nr:hypothetical protein FG386_001517 [Cryptosporidium ryanae]